MKAPKGGLAIAILEKAKKGEETEEEGSSSSQALSDAGSEVFSALRDGDEASFTEALKSFVSLCGMYGDED